jgi:hypothetical protein
MGILTRQQGEVFVITSDRASGSPLTTRAPTRFRLADAYEVWTGACWSPTKADAVSFASLDAADEYVRANFAKITG